MLVKNAIKVLEKFGTVVHTPPPGSSSGDYIGWLGLLTCNVTPGHQVRITTLSETETYTGGIRTQPLNPRGPTRGHDSLNAAVRWCLNQQYEAKVLPTLCGRDIRLIVGINHCRKFQQHAYFVARTPAAPEEDQHAYAYLHSDHPEALALAHGVVEGNYSEHALGDFLLETCPDFEAVWEAAKAVFPGEETHPLPDSWTINIPDDFPGLTEYDITQAGDL